MNAPAGQPRMKATGLANSIPLRRTVAIGTSVMIGAGIIVMSGQIAELTGPLFLLSIIAGVVFTAFSAYSYVKMSNVYALLFTALLAVGGIVVGGVPTTASGSVNEQQIVIMKGHSASCCGQPRQTTHHSGPGMHIACAFCVPIQHSFEQAMPRATGSDIFQRDFAITQSRNAKPEPFPPKIISTA